MIGNIFGQNIFICRCLHTGADVCQGQELSWLPTLRLDVWDISWRLSICSKNLHISKVSSRNLSSEKYFMQKYFRIRAKHFPRGWSFVQGARCLPILIGVPITGYLNTSSVNNKAGYYFSFLFVILGEYSSTLKASAPYKVLLLAFKANCNIVRCYHPVLHGLLEESSPSSS